MAGKAELVRLASVSAHADAPANSPGPRRVTIDAACRLPGRGAYLCRAADAGNNLPRGECLRKAVDRKALPRAFRHSVELPVELVESVGR